MSVPDGGFGACLVLRVLGVLRGGHEDLSIERHDLRLQHQSHTGDPNVRSAFPAIDSSHDGLTFDLAGDAITNRAPWLDRLGRPSANPTAQRRWVQAVATIAAYRDRWNITDQQRPLGSQPPASVEQAQQRTRATQAAQQAIRISQTSRPQPTQPVLETGIAGPGHTRGVDL